MSMLYGIYKITAVSAIRGTLAVDVTFASRMPNIGTNTVRGGMLID